MRARERRNMQTSKNDVTYIDSVGCIPMCVCLSVCNVYRITPNITIRDRYAKRPTGNISEKFAIICYFLANETERSIKAHTP